MPVQHLLLHAFPSLWRSSALIIHWLCRCLAVFTQSAPMYTFRPIGQGLQCPTYLSGVIVLSASSSSSSSIHHIHHQFGISYSAVRGMKIRRMTSIVLGYLLTPLFHSLSVQVMLCLRLFCSTWVSLFIKSWVTVLQAMGLRQLQTHSLHVYEQLCLAEFSLLDMRKVIFSYFS